MQPPQAQLQQVANESCVMHKSFVAGCLCILLTGCMHTVLRPIKCPDEPRRRDERSAISWDQGRAANQISGSVLRVDPFEPLVAASVDLRLVESTGSLKPIRTMPTGPAGEFAFDSIPPGRYLLRVRRIGFAAAQDTIDITTTSRITVRAVLAVEKVMLDGCGIFYYEKRVPWWIRK
jgi:hypothetical protein